MVETGEASARERVWRLPQFAYLPSWNAVVWALCGAWRLAEDQRAKGLANDA